MKGGGWREKEIWSGKQGGIGKEGWSSWEGGME